MRKAFISLLASFLLALDFHYGAGYARLGRTVERLSEMSGRGDLVIVSVLYFLFFL